MYVYPNCAFWYAICIYRGNQPGKVANTLKTKCHENTKTIDRNRTSGGTEP